MGPVELKTQLFRDTPHAGRAFVGGLTGEARHALSASTVRVHLRVEAGVISEARYEVRGCPDLIAALDLAVQSLVNQSVSSWVLDLRAIAQAVGAPTDKLGKLLTIEDAIRAAAIGFAKR